jgi:signal transduction histidine kinase
VGMHYTGGIVSPFIFVFFFLLMSETTYGYQQNQVGLLMSLLVYVTVVGLEYSGIVSPLPISAESIYRNPFAMVLSSGSFVLYILIVGRVYKTVIDGLILNIEKQEEEKALVRKELSRLDAPYQMGLAANKIVHDLRGPLGAVAGFITIIRNENKLTLESEEDCSIMLTELDRISNMLNRLLGYVKSGRMEKNPVCVVEVLDAVLSVISFHPNARNVRFDYNFSKEDGTLTHAIKEELQQVFFNILKNALEAFDGCDRPPVIKCDVVRRDGYQTIRIEDNGNGMTKNQLANLSLGISGKPQGTGLGLVIVHEILASYGGDMSVTSQEGAGTCVTIRLPEFHDVTTEKKGVIHNV